MPAKQSSRYIFDKLAHEGIDTRHLVHMPGLVTPISTIMIDPSGERTIVTFRDPELWKVQLPHPETLLEDCAAILTESRCAEFCTDLCAEARRRDIPVIVDVDRAMSLREGLLTASSHLVFSSEPLQETADVADDGAGAEKDRETDAVVSGGHARPARHDLARRARAICRRPRPSRSTPSIRWAPATCSTAHLRSPSPKNRNSARRFASPPPPRR